MAELKPRNTQTKVKHEILSRYLDVWGGIILGGLKHARKQSDWHFVYVDCFSYLGKYAGEVEDSYHREDREVDGSPLIGIRALDKLAEHARGKMGMSVKTNAILIERDKKTYQALINHLSCSGHALRLRATQDFESLQNGQIAVINADATLMADTLVLYTARPDTWAFYLIDPRGPSGIPYDFVKQIVSQGHHDVMINFIYEDLLRKTGMCLKENPRSTERQLVDNWTKAFGGTGWIKLAQETLLNEQRTRDFRVALDGIPLEDMDGIPFSDDELAEVKEQNFVSAYRNVLRSMDESLVTKLVNLRFGDKDRTMFYLFLTTHDPTGALALNQILTDAKYLEHELRYRLRLAKQTAPPPGQLTLWKNPLDMVAVPVLHVSPRPSVEEIGAFISQRFTGRRLTRKEIYMDLANTLYFPEELDKAVRYLRRQGLASFEGDLGHKTLISFC